MKILLVSENIPATKLGGLGKHVVALGNALLSAGHEVVLMGRDTPSYAECADEVGFNGRFIAGLGIPIKGWKEPQLGFFNPWKRSFFARRLARVIQTHAGEFDVVHYHGHQPMVGRYLPPSLNFVQTRHDQGGDCITNVRFRNGDVCRERLPAACAQCIHPNPGVLRTTLSALAVKRYRDATEDAFALHPVVFVSAFLRDNYLKTMPHARLAQSVVIHNFIDERAMSVLVHDSQPQPRSGSVNIHIVGRLDEPKGIAAFLDLLAPRLPAGWGCDVYGDGPLRGEIEIRHGGSGVRMHGHTHHRDILRATRSATVVVVPSVLEEAFGLVTLEALRLGKICYALRRGGTPELARYGAPGQLRLFDDLSALVNALIVADDFPDHIGGESADVGACLPALLAVYSRRIKEADHG